MSIVLRKAKDKLFFVLLVLCSLLLFLPFFSIFWQIFSKGIAAINWDFFTKLPGPMDEMHTGILNALVGSGIILFMASCIAIPWGVTLGVFLYDNAKSSSRLTNCIRLFVSIFHSTPSIIVGIVIYLWIVVPMKSFSALSGAVALSLIMMPLVVFSTEETLNLISRDIQEVAMSLGVPHYKTILKVMLPSAFRGIVAGILLGFVRIAGETAPLIFTAFGSPYLVCDIFKPMQTIPLLIFNYATSPYEHWQNMAWGASFFLVCVLLFLNVFVIMGLEKWKTKS